MIEQLKELIGKKFSYKDKDILIKNAKRVSGVYVVLTDHKTYNFFESEVPFFLKEIIEIPRVKIKPEALEKRKMELQQNNNTTEIVRTENVNFDIKGVLFDTLEKVKSNKDFIPQANAICNVVTQMINVQKLEMQLKNKIK
jgi:hypothetical protein